MNAIRVVLICLLTWVLSACSTTPAPVIDRLPSSKPSTAGKPAIASKPVIKPSTPKNGSDWRPDTYTVKKGDTLFSIGLEHGYYYKDIAQANDISSPYTIKIGQVLKFISLKEKPVIADNKPAPENVAQENTDGVVTYPMNSESSVAATNTAPAAPQVVALTEPKAIREPYSDEAFKKPLPAAKPISEKPTPLATSTTSGTVKPASDAKPEAKAEPKTETKPEPKTSADATDSLDWAWPAKGKVIAGFNEAGNKGIDIAGSMGQSITAAAPGKVIYSGSDLRGYGKLVIVKHNANYLSVYAHNSQILVKEGQQVSRGQKIAEMGNTDSNTVKLHFEIRQQGKSVDPAKYLASSESR